MLKWWGDKWVSMWVLTRYLPTFVCLSSYSRNRREVLFYMIMAFYRSSPSPHCGSTLLSHKDFLETGILKAVLHWTHTASFLGLQDASFWTMAVTSWVGLCLVDKAYSFYICEHVNQITVLKIPVIYIYNFSVPLEISISASWLLGYLTEHQTE